MGYSNDKYFQEVDMPIYKEELEKFLPEKIFDFHIHLWKKEHYHQPLSQETKKIMPLCEAFDEFSFNDLEETYKKLFPDKKWQAMVFGVPLREMDVKGMNCYIGKEIVNSKFSQGLLIPSLEASSEELEKEIDKFNFKGFKPYWTFVQGKDREEIRITDFLTIPQLEVADKKGLVIILHIPRKMRIADPLNLEDITDICTKYRQAKIVLAHIGRSYSVCFLEQVIDQIKGLENLYYGLAMVNDSEVIELLLEKVGPFKIIFGTDMPIAKIRGKHLCINKQCIFITRDRFSWSITSQRDGELRLTLFVYEEIRAIKRACERRCLSRRDIEAVFYNNAINLVT